MSPYMKYLPYAPGIAGSVMTIGLSIKGRRIRKTSLTTENRTD